MEVVFVVVVFVVGLAIYFVPALVAKGHPHRAAIFVVNLFMGWTLVGWVGCLAWALVRPQPATRTTDG